MIKEFVKKSLIILERNKYFKKIVYFQHKVFPLPLRIFDFLFSNSLIASFLAPYGLHVFLSSYEKRESNESYWQSKDSLYWHLYRQTHVYKTLLNIVSRESDLRDYLFLDQKNILEIGFGVGKTTKLLREVGLLNYNEMLVTDSNEHICNYMRKKNDFKSCMIKCMDVKEVIQLNTTFDLLVAHGGVLMYLAEKELNDLFNSLPHKKCKAVLISQEGVRGDDYFRDDGTAMYNFKTRLIKAGYGQGYEFFEIEDPKSSLLQMFAMIPKDFQR